MFHQIQLICNPTTKSYISLKKLLVQIPLNLYLVPRGCMIQAGEDDRGWG